MDIPKNITQIGESNHRCKIYVEDYVISYMKQLNQVAQDKDMAVALYGVRKEENEVSYLFLYGACKLTFLQRETRHLSQAQQQEIEKNRVRYFPEQSFLGYRLLNGEMIEGFHICEQGICRYIAGYAQFYEKNDSMLAYMLDARRETAPEEVNQQKYEEVKKKQEERRALYEENTYKKPPAANSSGSLRGMRVAVVMVFALLCMIGLTSMNGEGKMQDLQAMARQVIDGAMEQKIPDATNSLVAEDKLAEAVLQENAASTAVQVSAAGMTEMPKETQQVSIVEPDNVMAPEQNPEDIQTQPSEEIIAEVSEIEPVVESATESVVEPTAEPVSYVIQNGDTLIGICVRNYGSDSRVSEICALNQIQNPDDIKVGQKILLP